MIGMFVNTLVLRTEVGRATAFVDLLGGCGRLIFGVRACGCAVRAVGGGAQSGAFAGVRIRCSR